MRYLFLTVFALFSWSFTIAQITVFPHNENFESFTTCVESCISACPLSNGWTNPITDNTDWIVDENGTATPGTGPTSSGGADHNPGIAGGNYLYLEANSCFGDTALLISPSIDLSGGVYPYMTFWYHMFGGTMGTLNVDISTNGGLTYSTNVIAAISSNNDVWQMATVDLNAYANQTIVIRFRGIIGAGSSSDMALDDISIFLVEQMDVAVTNIQSNDSLFCNYPTNELCVEITNTDTIPLDSGVLNVRINGVLFNSPMSFNSVIAPGTTGIFCFGQAPLVAGDVVSAVISQPNGLNDPISANDSIAETIAIQSLPTISLVNETICPDDSVQIGGAPTGPLGASYSWSTSGGFLSSASISNPIASTNATEKYYVTVTDTNGCISNDSLTVSNFAIPIVDAGVDTVLCPSSSYTFGGSPTSVTGINFSWIGPLSTVLSNAANPTLTNVDVGQYVVVVEDANTCENSDTILISAFSLVSPNAGIDSTVCKGDSLQMGSIPSAAFVSYTWSPGIFMNDSTLSNPLTLINNPNQFILEVLDTFGCVLFDTVDVNIDTLPSADAGPNGNSCALDSLLIGGSPTSFTGIAFNWSPAILFNDPTLANPLVAVITDTTYYLTVTDGNGCQNFDSVQVLAVAQPAVDAGADQGFCVGDVAILGGFPVAIPGSVYNWSPGLLLNDSTLSNPSYAVNASQQFILEVTDPNGCIGLDTVLIFINATSVLSPSLDTTVCLNDTFLLSSPASAAFAAFSWASPAYMTDVNTNPLETFVTGTTQYILAATDTFGCGYIDTVVVSNFPATLVDAGSDQLICSGDSFQLGGSPSGSVGSFFQWKPFALVNDSSLSNPLGFSLTDTSFTLIVTDVNTCKGFDTVLISIAPLPTIDAGGVQGVCLGSNVILGGAPTGPPMATYSWSPGIGLSDSTTSNPSFIVSDTISFTLQVTDTNGCISLDTAVANAFPLSTVLSQDDTTICTNASVQIGKTQPVVFTAYNWSPGILTLDSTASITTVSAPITTQYILELTDVFGCAYFDTTVVEVQPIPNAAAGIDTTLCFSTIYALGGAPTGPSGASYNWTSNLPGFPNGDTNSNPIIEFISAGTFEFIVEVTDSVGCPAFDTVSIAVNPAVPADAGLDKLICSGDSVIVGGAPTAVATSTLTWSSTGFISNVNASNPQVSALDTTLFFLNVIDTLGCLGIDTVIVNTYPLSGIDAGPDTAICIGETLNLGSSPTASNVASIVWSPGITLNDSTLMNPVATIAAATSYGVTVTDVFGCISSDSINLGVNPLPIVDAGADSVQTCALVDFNVGGAPSGPAGSSFLWSPGSAFNDSTLANPLANVSTNALLVLQVTDVNGCSALDSVFVETYALPQVDAGAASVSICKGDSIQIGGAPTSTTVGATYAWSSPANLSNSSISNPMASVVVPTFFTVTVTEPINSCISIDSILIDTLASPDISAGIDTTICIGDSVQIGGSPTSAAGSTFLWAASSGIIGASNSANPFVQPTVSTSYYLTVTDALGCESYDTVVVSLDPLPIVSFTTSSIPCHGDTIQVTASGGQTYLWTNNTYFSDLDSANPMVLIPNLITLYIEVTDSNQCATNDSISITPHILPVANAGVDLDVCNGQSVQLLATTATSTISWSPSSSLNNSSLLNPVASPQSNTDYVLTATTGGGACVDSDTMTVNVIPLPIISLVDTIEYCDQSVGEASPIVSDPLNYSWTTNSPLITLLNPTDSLLTFNATASGYIYLEVVNLVTGCISYDSVYIQWYPKPIGITSATPAINCIGDSVQLNAFGSDNYQWVPSIGLTNNAISNPILEVYGTNLLQVIVTSNDGCSDTVDVQIDAAPLVVANAGQDDEICQLDTIQLSASGGLTYQWTADAALSAINVSNPDAYPAITKTFTVKAFDQYGCFGTDQVQITVNPLPVFGAGSPKRVCLGSSVQIGGNIAVPNNSSYLWTPAQFVDDATLANPFVSPDVTRTFYVTVTTPKGCMDSANVLVTVDTLPTLELISQPLSVCRGDSTEIEVTGGISKYRWTPSTTVSDSTRSRIIVFPTQSTTYSVIASNARNCSSKLEIDVEIFQLPVIDPMERLEVCLNDSVRIEAKSSTGVSYYWSPTDLVSDSLLSRTFAKPAETTDYQVAVTDENGCVATAVQKVKVNPLPFADAGEDIEDCDISSVYLGGNTTALPGDAVTWSPAEYLDDPYALNPLAITAERTTFVLEVQNNEGCFSRDSIQVNSDCYSIIYAPTAFTPGNNGKNDYFLLTYYRIVDPNLKIYDRWGEIVFETKDLTVGWDGRFQFSGEDAPVGVYYWSLTYKSDELKKLSKEGIVTLLR